jgi:hypothetical protein
LNLKHDLLCQSYKFVKMVWCMIALILLSSETGGNVAFLKRSRNVLTHFVWGLRPATVLHCHWEKKMLGRALSFSFFFDSIYCKGPSIKDFCTFFWFSDTLLPRFTSFYLCFFEKKSLQISKKLWHLPFQTAIMIYEWPLSWG